MDIGGVGDCPAPPASAHPQSGDPLQSKDAWQDLLNKSPSRPMLMSSSQHCASSGATCAVSSVRGETRFWPVAARGEKLGFPQGVSPGSATTAVRWDTARLNALTHVAAKVSKEAWGGIYREKGTKASGSQYPDSLQAQNPECAVSGCAVIAPTAVRLHPP